MIQVRRPKNTHQIYGDESVKILGVRLGSAYGVLDEQFIQFDPSYLITFYEGGNEIIIRNNPENINGFFGDRIGYISGVVGKNGVGKSTLIRYLKNLFMKDSQNLQERESDIIFYKDADIFYAYVNEKQKSSIRILQNETGLDVEIIYYRGYPKIYDRIKNFTTVFYSNSLDQEERETETTNFFNISTNFLSDNIGKINRNLKNKKIRNQSGAKRFRFTELMRQIEFVNMLRDRNKELDIPFKSINQISLRAEGAKAVEYKKLVKYVEGFLKDEEIDSEGRDTLGMFVKKTNDLAHEMDRLRKEYRFTSASLYLNVLENFNLYLVKVFFSIKGILDMGSLRNEVFDIFLLGMEGHFDPRGYRELLEQKFMKSKDVLEELLNISERDQEYGDLLEQVNITRSFLSRFFDIAAQPDRNSDSISISTKERRLSEFLKDFYGNSYDFSFITFSWPSLSAGEASLIAFFSRMYSIAEEIKSENVLLLIDEGDLYFHPEWQRDYIYFLLEFLNNMLRKVTNSSIILTTHSPFLLSDLPSENVVLLIRKADGLSQIARADQFHIETFGGNIHTLFSKAFFLDESTVSRFAKNKIKREVIEPLQSERGPEDVRDVEKLIDKVGEPVLKLALQDLFDKRYDLL